MSLKEYWEEVTSDDWEPVSSLQTIAITIAALYVLSQHLLTDDKWVFLLDHANLAIHEAGHPIIRIFSNRLSVYGGTIFQLLFPLLFIHHFWRQRNSLGFAASWIWLGSNLLNVARYMKDARIQQLPLVGGGDHDWTEIFTRWNVLTSDTEIGGFFGLLGITVCFSSIFWIWITKNRSK